MSLGREYDIILFDLDGTLADSIAFMRSVYFGFLNEFGHPGSDAEFERLNGLSLREIVETLKTSYRLEPDTTLLFNTYRDAIASQYVRNAVPKKGVTELLPRLKRLGFLLGLVTSASESVAKSFLQANHLLQFFDSVVSGTDVMPGKPDPALYREALVRFSATAERAVAIEDSANGVKAARDAGIFTLFLSEHGGDAQTIHSLNEVLQFVISVGKNEKV